MALEAVVFSEGLFGSWAMAAAPGGGGWSWGHGENEHGGVTEGAMDLEGGTTAVHWEVGASTSVMMQGGDYEELHHSWAPSAARCRSLLPCAAPLGSAHRALCCSACRVLLRPRLSSSSSFRAGSATTSWWAFSPSPSPPPTGGRTASSVAAPPRRRARPAAALGRPGAG